MPWFGELIVNQVEKTDKVLLLSLMDVRGSFK
jgi:hypothetical protein